MPKQKPTIRERIADRLTGGVISSQRRDLEALDQTVAHVKEALVELEAERRVSGGAWGTIGPQDGKQNDFSRQEVRSIARDGRLKYLKAPLIRRSVDVSALYTFAQGVTVHCEDRNANKVLQEFWDERSNRKAFTSVTSLFTKEVERKTQGNIFLALFAATGETTRIRSIPADQFTQVVFDAEDAAEILYYRREWTARVINPESGVETTETRDEYWPSLNFFRSGAEIPGIFAGKPVQPFPVYHIKTGCLSDMDFGVPDTYPAHAWDSSYTEFLEDRASVAASLSVYSWIGKVKQGIARFAGNLVTAAGRGTRNAIRGGADIAAGQIGVMRQSDGLDPVNVAGATIDPDEGRAYRLMTVSALGLSEPLGTGDVSTGNLATAESLEWPTALMFMLVQALWEEVFSDIASYVLAAAGFDAKGAGIVVDWPPIIHQNTVDTVNAIVQAAPHLPGEEGRRWIARRLVSALGEDKVDEIVNKLDFKEQKPAIDPALLNGKGNLNGKVPLEVN